MSKPSISLCRPSRSKSGGTREKETNTGCKAAQASRKEASIISDVTSSHLVSYFASRRTSAWPPSARFFCNAYKNIDTYFSMRENREDSARLLFVRLRV